MVKFCFAGSEIGVRAEFVMYLGLVKEAGEGVPMGAVRTFLILEVFGDFKIEEGR